MKVLVLGATAGTGIKIAHQAIAQRSPGTAFVRSPGRLKPFAGQMIVKQGDLLNSAVLADAIKGHEVALPGFGPRVPIAREDANLQRDFATAVTAAVQRTSVKAGSLRRFWGGESLSQHVLGDEVRWMGLSDR
jgi:putative NADH-flavin reductase